ncbi:hypothetical protein thsps21_47020 [Pseudomonas sp. No.21]|uniref:DUF883 domain-containing protein n=1 Tax=Pseudomonas TaxID=286 RepID=UPI001F433622|nr:MULTISPECIES: DUF883 domain-containing protein [Pseudomonas]MDW3713162.1 DUF883 domain-containing protein [Pseudomonas sp. 2023EL-01195]GJN46219.1 hypothetical protein TUM20249_22050 [Pseudomonas tohonis]
MALFMSRKKSTLQGIEQEIEQLRSGIERIKHVVEAESQHSLDAIQSGALHTLSRSRDLAGQAWERTARAGIATRDYSREHPLATAGVAAGAVGVVALAAYMLRHRS